MSEDIDNEDIKTISINSCFFTVQGEGFNVGTRALFVRMPKCNLKCTWCFGVRPGRKKPMIAISRGKNKPINLVEIGDRLMTFDSDMSLVETTVTGTVSREVDQWYEITIEGSIYFVTPEHPFFTTRGMIEAKNLRVGDDIFHSTSSDKLSFSMTHSNPMKNPEVSRKKADNTDYVTMGKRVSLTIAKKKELGVYSSAWSLLSEKQKTELREKSSLAKIGEKNPNWRGGKHRNWESLKGQIDECSMCGEIKKLEVHHLDEDQSNDSLDNLTTICHKCHSIIHQRGYNFWKTGDELISRQDGKVLAANGMRVEKIIYRDRMDSKHFESTRPKPLEVFNLTCHPHNTYLVDYMWVHNCDTEFDSAEEWTEKDLVEFATREGTRFAVLTGGEPLLNKQSPHVIRILEALGYEIAVETNGTMPYMQGIDWVTCSPKKDAAYKIHRDLKDKVNEYKYVVDDDFDFDILKRHFFGGINYNPDVELWLSPEYSGFKKNVAKILEYITEHPQWRINLQTHKILEIE